LAREGWIVDDPGTGVECPQLADLKLSHTLHGSLTSMSVVQPLLVIGCRVAERP
jgi:hypothetical protein